MKKHYCDRCRQYTEEKHFERHHLINPEPKRKMCDRCYEEQDPPFAKSMTNQVKLARMRKPKINRADIEFTEKRRRVELALDIKRINDEYEL